MKTITETLIEADDVEVDALWAILKYKSIGILRKLKCISLILDLDEDQVIKESPKDSNGRILDKETRDSIHDSLIKRSKQLLKND